MCIVDVGVLGQVWIYSEAPEAYVDLNTVSQCWNFGGHATLGRGEADAGGGPPGFSETAGYGG